MRWGDAPYVRLYTEPDALFAALPWEARALFRELLMAASRTGEIAVGRHDPSRDVTDCHAKSRRVLATLVRMPVEVVTQALADLLDDGCLVETDTAFVIRNYLEAQTTPRTDAARKRQERERHRDTALSHEMSRAVTKCHTITEQSRAEQNRAEQTDIERGKPRPARSVSTKKVTCATTLREGQEITETQRAFAVSLGVNPATEWPLFVDYWVGTGKPMKDWNATWRNWCRRSLAFAASKGRATAPSRSAPLPPVIPPTRIPPYSYTDSKGHHHDVLDDGRDVDCGLPIPPDEMVRLNKEFFREIGLVSLGDPTDALLDH